MFGGLEYEKCRIGMARGNGEVHRHSADEKPRIAARPLEDPGKHCRHRGLAMRAGDGEYMPPCEHVLREPLRTGHISLALIKNRFHQWIAARDHVSYQPQVGLELELILAESFGELDAERSELFAHRRIDIRIAARH